MDSKTSQHLKMIYFFFFFKCYGPHRDLHSFPTRRSSDLPRRGLRGGVARHPFDAQARGHRRVGRRRSEEHTSELQSPYDIVCRLPLEKKKPNISPHHPSSDSTSPRITQATPRH